MTEKINPEIPIVEVHRELTGVSLKHHLLRLVALAVLPIVLLTLMLIGHLVLIQRDSMKLAMLEKARLASVAIDREPLPP
jgi:hypothetical protein